MQKVFVLILGQCAPAIHDRVQALSEWEDINAKPDAIQLLSFTRQCLYQWDNRRNPTHALIEAETALFQFRQGEWMSNLEYLEKLCELVEVYEHLGGEPGSQTGRVKGFLDDADTNDEDQLTEANNIAREEYMAALLLVKSDPKCYGRLIADIETNSPVDRTVTQQP